MQRYVREAMSERNFELSALLAWIDFELSALLVWTDFELSALFERIDIELSDARG